MKDTLISRLQNELKKSCYENFKMMIEKYMLITNGDRIAIEIADDKNSVLLTSCLIEYVKEYNGAIELEFIVVEKDNSIPENIIELFDIKEYTVVKESELDKVYSIVREKGCTKLALPHNYNDILNSTFMTLKERNTVAKIEPKRYSEKSNKLQFIRPLCLIEDSTVRKFMESVNLSCKEEVTAFSRLAFIEEQVVIPNYKSEQRFEFNIYQRI